jgi:hypothetical protein
MLSEKERSERLSKLVFWMLHAKDAKFRWAADVQRMWMMANWPVPLPSEDVIRHACYTITDVQNLRQTLEYKASGSDIRDDQVAREREHINERLKSYGLMVSNPFGLVTRLYPIYDTEHNLELMELA